VTAILLFDVQRAELASLGLALHRAGHTLVATSPVLREALAGRGTPCRSFESLTPAGARERAQREAEALCGELARGATASALARVLGSLHEPLAPELPGRIAAMVRDQRVAIDALDALADALDLRLIVLGCDNTHVQRAVLGRARARGIPSLLLAHGITSPPPCGRVAGEMEHAYSDHIAVYGPRARDMLIGAGVAADRITCAGDPLAQVLGEAGARLDAAAARRAIGLEPERPVVTFLASYSDGSTPALALEVTRRVQAHMAVARAIAAQSVPPRLLVRPHPNELARAPHAPEALARAVRAYCAWWAELGVPDVVIEARHKVESIRAADVVLVEGESTVIGEGMLLDRPVVALERVGARHVFTEADGISVANDAELAERLGTLLADPGARRLQVERQRARIPELYSAIGDAAIENISRLALDLAERGAGASRGAPALVVRGSPVASAGPSRLRILEVVHGFPPRSNGGTELYTWHLVRELVRRGHRVKVFHPVIDPRRAAGEIVRSTLDGIERIELARSGLPRGPTEFWDPSLDPAFAALVREERFDLVHVQHLLGLSASLVPVAKQAGLPVAIKLDDLFFTCASYHRVARGNRYCEEGPDSLERCFACRFGPWTEREPQEVAAGFAELAGRRAVLRRVLSQVDFVQCASTFVRDDLRRWEFGAARVEVLRTGIAPFERLPRRASSDGRIRVGFLGAIHRRKGIEVFLDAVSRYRAHRGGGAPLAFSVHGGSSGDRALDERVEACEREGLLRAAGSFAPEERGRVFAELDLAVVPSLGENYPFVLREALYAGVPVAASRIAGVPEIVREGENGFLLPPGDAGALCALFESVSDRPELLAHLFTGAPSVRLLGDEVDELEPILLGLAGRTPQREAPAHRREAQVLFAAALERAHARAPRDGELARLQALVSRPRS
jgi:glycosyltransferase involved in cell wall biosynthesis